MANNTVNPNKEPTKSSLASRKYRNSPKGRAYRERTKQHYAKYNKERRDNLIAAGLCAYCGKCPPRPRYRSCQRCSDTVTAATKVSRARAVADGRCPNCGKNPVLPAMQGKSWSFCESCYFKKTSIDCLKTAKHAELIGEKLRQQNYRCAYTGEEIILGLNDSLDHILPIVHFPELRSDPTNVEWVTRKVNCMKWDSTRDEFIATAYAVVKHYESQLT